jgi:acyl-CoA hydrolase
MTSDGSNRPPGKTVSESQVTMARQMMPADANPWGYVHGGVVMKMVDEAAGSAAIRHVRCRVATAAIDFMSFLHPVHVGDMITLKASVNDVGRTSMEVGVRVETENMLSGERNHTSSAYVVMVALDGDGRPVHVPPVIAETADEQRRMAAAKIRRAQRKVLEKALKESADELASPTPVSHESSPLSGEVTAR